MAGGCLGCPSFRVRQPHRWLCRCPHRSTGHPAPGAAPRSEVPLSIRCGPGHCQAPQGCRLPALHNYMRVVSTAACIANQICVSATRHTESASSAPPAQSWVHGNLDWIKIHRKVAKPQAVGWTCIMLQGEGCRVRETYQCCAGLAWQSWCARLQCAPRLQQAGADPSPALPDLWWSLLYGLKMFSEE